MTVNDPTQLIEEGAAAIRLSGPGPRPAGPRRQSFDVIVIGGGQAGLSVGYHLAARRRCASSSSRRTRASATPGGSAGTRCACSRRRSSTA